MGAMKSYRGYLADALWFWLLSDYGECGPSGMMMIEESDRGERGGLSQRNWLMHLFIKGLFSLLWRTIFLICLEFLWGVCGFDEVFEVFGCNIFMRKLIIKSQFSELTFFLLIIWRTRSLFRCGNPKRNYH